MNWRSKLGCAVRLSFEEQMEIWKEIKRLQEENKKFNEEVIRREVWHKFYYEKNKELQEENEKLAQENLDLRRMLDDWAWEDVRCTDKLDEKNKELQLALCHVEEVNARIKEENKELQRLNDSQRNLLDELHRKIRNTQILTIDPLRIEIKQLRQENTLLSHCIDDLEITVDFLAAQDGEAVEKFNECFYISKAGVVYKELPCENSASD